MPVILMTGDKSLETIQTIRELNIDDYITKPLNVAITKEVVYGQLHKAEMVSDRMGRQMSERGLL